MERLITLLLSIHCLSFNAIAQKDTSKDTSHIPDEKGVYTYVDQIPEPTFDILAYLHSKLTILNPKDFGKTVIKFVVQEDGTCSNFTVLKAPSDEIGKECVRVLKSMPKWHSAIEDNNPVKCYYKLPLIIDP